MDAPGPVIREMRSTESRSRASRSAPTEWPRIRADRPHGISVPWRHACRQCLRRRVRTQTEPRQLSWSAKRPLQRSARAKLRLRAPPRPDSRTRGARAGAMEDRSDAGPLVFAAVRFDETRGKEQVAVRLDLMRGAVVQLEAARSSPDVDAGRLPREGRAEDSLPDVTREEDAAAGCRLRSDFLENLPDLVTAPGGHSDLARRARDLTTSVAIADVPGIDDQPPLVLEERRIYGAPDGSNRLVDDYLDLGIVCDPVASGRAGTTLDNPSRRSCYDARKSRRPCGRC